VSRLTLSAKSDAQAVIQEAEALEWETQRAMEDWSEEAGDGLSRPSFAASQERYLDLRRASETVVAILYQMQEPLLDDPYASWAAKLMVKAKGLLTDIDEGELVAKTTFVPASGDND